MALHWVDSEYTDGGSQISWEDGEHVFRRGWRLDDSGKRHAALIVRPAADPPSGTSLDRLTHEYELKDELDGAWAARPLELVRNAGRTALVLEDAGGEPLDRLLGEPMQMGRFLPLAIAIAMALGKLHQRGLVHKDVKPANILVNGAAGEVRLTGFGIASRSPRERQSPHPPEAIAGTLAYMAPEQTGRMNRSVDSRSDLYALGITFYQMLTGTLPFTAADPMEWVHCHLARQPLAPAERRNEIPAAVSTIVMKLLAKRPEDRYQTAAGLESDLRSCQTPWEAQRRVDEFPLGRHDTPDRLLIPERLYGRRREAESLLAAFDRVASDGAPELVLVSGYSGIGKSAVVNELQPGLAARRGLFAGGKFDQHKRDIPYSTLAQSFQSLVRPLLAKSDAELGEWREALDAALGPNGQLMVDLVPDLKLIIGEQAPLPELPPQNAEQRFQLVFRRFLAVFARQEHPLALFLDDLQWLDAATLDLIENLLTHPDVRNVLLIGAYRDNEVTSAHPLIGAFDRLRRAGVPVQDIVLAPLAREHVGQLIADSLCCDRERAAPLAELVHEKTAGNPFFIIQFLTTLVEEGLLTFDHATARWLWDPVRIHAKGYTDNIIELMVGKLSRLPARTQSFLQRLACLGNSAQIAQLTMVSEGAAEELDRDLQDALQNELVLVSAGTCRFVHDRVQEAAYSLIPEGRRAEAHLRIGRLLVTHTPAEERNEAIFEIVNQLDRGAALITSPDEKERLAEFNLIAGKRARSSTAYASALRYLVAGAALLCENGWDSRPDLAFELDFHRAECEFLTGELAAAEARLTMLASRAVDPFDRAAVACLRNDLYTTLDRSDRAVDVCLDYLRQLGVDWSPHPTDDDARREYERTWSLLGDREIETLIDLPLMSNREAAATLEVLMRALSPAIFTDINLFSLILWRMVNLSLEYGNTDASCYAYVHVGAVAGPRFGNYKAGFRFGQLGYDLVEQRGLKRLQGRIHLGFAVLVLSWAKHWRTASELIRHSFNAMYSAADLMFAAYSWHNLIGNFLAIGKPLAEVQREAERGLDYARTIRFGLVVDNITAQLSLVRTLRGLTETFGVFNDVDVDEAQFECRLSDPRLAFAAGWYWTRKLQARFFAGDYSAAIDASLHAQRLRWTSPGFVESAEAHFYGALSHAAACDAASPDQCRQHVEALTAHHRQLVEWAENCPENFQNRAALVAAEIARIEGRELDAERLYEAAIKSARENEFVHNAALANELAARFHAARGFETIANAYLREARSCYLRWGADGKVRQLEALHPHLREPAAARAAAATIAAPIEHLDYATVMKVSQAVSGEMVLERLIDTLMRLAIEHAGAERSLLLLTRGSELHQEAEAVTGAEGIIVRRGDDPAAMLPASIVHYVIRTREVVILNDASAHPAYASDPYVRQRRTRSILCLPLVNQGKVIGVLYLENNLTPHVFTPDRVTVLKVMASQAAISLENSRLYRDLADRERRIGRLVDANVIGICIWDLDGAIFTANEEYLRMLQYGPEDVAAGRLRWTDLTPAEWRAQDERAIAELRSTGTFQPVEKEYFRKDGSRLPVLIGGALFEEGGNEGVAFILDLTERKRAEEALRESERSLRSVMDGIPGLVGILAPNGEVESVNRRIVEYCGQPLEELRNWATNGTVHHEDLPHLIDVFTKSIAAGIPYQIEHRLRRYDGEYRWFDDRGVPIRDDAGHIECWYVLLTDIEDRTRAVARLQQMQSDFAHVNRVATMGQLSASIAHEVSQPITGAVTNASVALRVLRTAPPNVAMARGAIERIVRDCSRASEVVERVRALIKKTPARKDVIDVNEALRETVRLAHGEFVRRGVSVQTQLAGDLPQVEGDRVQLQQVFLNLIINAAEAMSAVTEGSRHLTISTGRDNAAVLVAVQDSGPGIDPAHVDRIFSAFYTTKESGLGMGLSISRSIVEAHGGRLWATNRPQGALFQLTLPESSESQS